MSKHTKSARLVDDVYSELFREERLEAHETLKAYLGVVSRIFKHLQQYDPKVLTELRRRARLRKKAEKAHR
jgi:hypothetical protein